MRHEVLQAIFRKVVKTPTLLLAGLILLFSQELVVAAPRSGQPDAPGFWKVQTIETAELGIPGPLGLAFSPVADAFLLPVPTQRGEDSCSELDLVSPFTDLVGSVQLAAAIPAPRGIVFDERANRLLFFDSASTDLVQISADSEGKPGAAPSSVDRYDVQDLDIGRVGGMTADPESGRLYLLDTRARSILWIDPDATGSLDADLARSEGRLGRMRLAGLADGELRGLAFNPQDKQLYLLLDGSTVQLLYELTEGGEVVTTRDLTSIELRDPQGMLFAPSADLTDDPGNMHLYIADRGQGVSGSGQMAGAGIVELSLTSVSETSGEVGSSPEGSVDASAWSSSRTGAADAAYDASGQASASDASQACERWVAPPPTGSDKNSGTSSSPWATLKHAADTVPDSKCTVWFRQGTYSASSRLNRRFATTTTFKSAVPYKAILEYRGPVVAISGGTNITLEGFEMRHSGAAGNAQVVAIDQSSKGWAENIILRNNIIHDSYGDDLLKIYDGARYVTVQGNVFYNQGATQQHIDVNSVTDVVILDNIFFNDAAGSGRAPYDSQQYISIKDSNGDADGLVGSERVTVRRNVFLNWEGRAGDTILQVGVDEKPYYEAKDVWIENNLIIGNSWNGTYAAFGVRGARDVLFANNTVAGNLPGSHYGLWVTISGQNPPNENIRFYNNIWSDPTGTMGSFSAGRRTATNNLVLDNNLYWNGSRSIPAGSLLSPRVDDANRVVADPRLNRDQSKVVLPRWNGGSFLSGNATVRDEFQRLVGLYGAIPADSAAAGKANPAYAPVDDILGRLREASPSLGAYEARPVQ